MPVLLKWLKKFSNVFKEKTPIKSDDFELEHFLLYHGLVGSAPDGQREFKDVRADLKLAVESQDSRQMASVLKLPPLWWDERLKTIFGEIDDKKLSIALLAPDVNDDALIFEHVPLLNQDWQVRANAALQLAHLLATEEIAKLEQSLHDTRGSAPIAFCHQAYAVGKLGVASSEEALAKYLEDEEPWIRVDAAGALAELTKQQPSARLISALLQKHKLSDYTAVAVTRHIKPQTLFEIADQRAKLAGCELVLDILDSAKQTFSDDMVIEARLPDCFSILVRTLLESPSCPAARSAIALAAWLETHRSYTLLSPPPQETIEQVLAYKESTDLRQLVEDTLTRLDSQKQLDLEDEALLRSAIVLAGEHAVSGATKSLLKLLKSDHSLLDVTISALEATGSSEAAQPLISLARELVDIDDRCEQTKAMHPVAETHPEKARTYWLILKALARMPSPSTLDFLLKCTSDCAPDKRSQALESLAIAAAASTESERSALSSSIAGRLTGSLADPSVEVRKVALRGIARLVVIEDLKSVVLQTRAREVSLSKEAFETLSELAKKGHKPAVVETITQALKSETDGHKRQRLRDFIDRLPA